MEPTSYLHAVLAVLATWRVTHLLVAEDGPAAVIVRLRVRLGDGVLGRAMDCFYCLSLWVAAPLALLLASDVRTWVLGWLGLSGGACLIERLTADDSEPLTARTVREGDTHGLLRTATAGGADDLRTADATTDAGTAPGRLARSDGAHLPG